MEKAIVDRGQPGAGWVGAGSISVLGALAITGGCNVPRNDRLYRLSLNASYTWSRLEGNWDIDYADSLFYNSSILQDGPGVLITDNRDGLLRGDRTHLFKLFASIEPIERWRAGTYVRYQSGGTWEARSQPATNVPPL